MEKTNTVLKHALVVGTDCITKLECGIQMYRKTQELYNQKGSVLARRNIVKCFVEFRKKISALENYSVEHMSPTAVNYCSDLLRAADIKSTKLNEVSDFLFYPKIDKSLKALQEVQLKYIKVYKSFSSFDMTSAADDSED